MFLFFSLVLAAASPTALSSAQPLATIGPLQYGVRFSLTPIAQKVRLGQPVNLSIWLRNTTAKAADICVAQIGTRLHFQVTNADGVVLPDHAPSATENARSPVCMLAPVSQRRFVVPLSDFVTVSQPGSYVVRATIVASFDGKLRTLSSNPATLIVTP